MSSMSNFASRKEAIRLLVKTPAGIPITPKYVTMGDLEVLFDTARWHCPECAEEALAYLEEELRLCPE